MKRMLWIITLAVCSSVWANAQTIADIARSERARKKDAPKADPITNATVAKAKPGAVVSSPTPSPIDMAGPRNETLVVSPIPGPNTATPSPAAAKTPEIKQEAPQEPPKDPRDEKWWRGQFDQARTDLRRAENQAAVAQLELNAANRDYLTRAYDPDGRGPSAIGAATAKLDAANRSAEEARGKLGALEEELRRSGAPAGWGR
jgi:hypothetical protein